MIDSNLIHLFSLGERSQPDNIIPQGNSIWNVEDVFKLISQ